MLYRQACEEYSKGLGHGPLESAVDVTYQTLDTCFIKTSNFKLQDVWTFDETLYQVFDINIF